MKNFLWRNKAIYIIIMLYAVSICVPNVLSVNINKQTICLEYSQNRDFIWVDDNNTEGPWNGTFEFPYREIQDAINNTTPSNNTIKVVSGVYERFKCEKNGIKILGMNYHLPEYDPALYPIIDGKFIGNVVTFVNCFGCTFDSFIVKNGEYTPGLAGVYI